MLQRSCWPLAPRSREVQELTVGIFAILGDTFPFLRDFQRGRGAHSVGLQTSEGREEGLKVGLEGTWMLRGLHTFRGPNRRSGDHSVKL